MIYCFAQIVSWTQQYNSQVSQSTRKRKSSKNKKVHEMSRRWLKFSSIVTSHRQHYRRKCSNRDKQFWMFLWENYSNTLPYISSPKSIIGCLLTSFTCKVYCLPAKQTWSQTHTSCKSFKFYSSTAKSKIIFAITVQTFSNTMQSLTTTYWQVSSLTHFTLYSKWSSFYQTLISKA